MKRRPQGIIQTNVTRLGSVCREVISEVLVTVVGQVTQRIVSDDFSHWQRANSGKDSAKQEVVMYIVSSISNGGGALRRPAPKTASGCEAPKDSVAVLFGRCKCQSLIVTLPSAFSVQPPLHHSVDCTYNFLPRFVYHCVSSGLHSPSTSPHLFRHKILYQVGLFSGFCKNFFFFFKVM